MKSFIQSRPAIGYASCVILLSVFVLFLSSSNSNMLVENSSWELIYENDANGNVIQGSVGALIHAVQQGKEVRILTDNKKGTEYSSNAEHVWIKDGIVYIQNTSNISVTWEGDQLVMQDDAYHFYYTINTNGDRHMSRWLVGTHTPKNSSSNKIGVKWFVK